MNSAEILFSVAGSAAIFFSALFAGIRHLVKSYLHELMPNSGHSIKDQINKLEGRVDSIYEILLEKK